MAEERRAVAELAGAVLDGTPVDWDAAESSSPASDRDLIPHLRLVARIAEAHRAQPAPVPATWGHLQLRERIGGGAFGDVHRAWDTRLEREVALKLLKADADHGGRSSVISEAALLARVRHPNIVTVYGAERVGGQVGLWMELIEGRGLDRVLLEQGPFSAHEAAVVGLTICRALSAVHRVGLVHRDIKAQNVMREDGGRIVLMDFGTGVVAESGNRTALAGTPLYLAPELLTGATPSVASDIYGVGVLVFHLTSGTFPIGAADLKGLRRAHAEGRKRFLRDERPDLPDDFVAVVETAIAADPASRYPTAGAMESALAAVVGSGAGRRGRPRRWLVASLVAAGIAAAAVAVKPRTWRAGALTLSGGLPPTAGSPPSDVAVASPLVVRQVALPGGMLVGRPAPDGRVLSFSTDEGDLALFELASGTVRPLTAHEPETSQHTLHSAISADGEHVAYTWMALDGRYEMRVIGADGKRPRVVLRSDAVDEPEPVEWSRDGSSILSVLTGADGAHRLAFVAADGTGITPLKELGTAAPDHASRSPDGALVVFDAPATATAPARDILLMDADGSDTRPLVSHPADDIAPVWTPDGRRVLFVSDRSGTMDLWSVAVVDGAAHGEPELVHRGIGRLRFLGLTDQGGYYYQSVAGAVDVYWAEVSADGAVGPPVALAARYAGSNISPVWSPDGRRVAYSRRSGRLGRGRPSTTLAVVDVDSGTHGDVTPDLASFLVRSWSPDGRRVLVQGSDLRGLSGLFAIDVEDGTMAPIVVAGRPRDDLGIGTGEWLHDGRVLYRRRDALVVRDIASGLEEVVLHFRAEGIRGIAGVPGGRGFAMAADGTLAFSAMIEGATSLRVKPRGQPSREVLRAPPSERLVLQDLARDGRTLLFTRRQEGERQSLWRMASDGVPVPLPMDLPAVREVSLRGDGRRIAFTAGVPIVEVWVMENFLR